MNIFCPITFGKTDVSFLGATIVSIPYEFLIFSLILIGIAFFHKHALPISVAGLLLVIMYKYFVSSHFSLLHHWIGDSNSHGEWRSMVNLVGLLLGFGILSKHFEDSHLPLVISKLLPSDWRGGFLLLFMIFVMSAFLDNIAAAIIGGTIASTVYKKRVHIGFLAAIVAASNAGGTGSVIGDTTTTLMWISGISAWSVLPAYIAAVPAFLLFGTIGALQQQKYQPLIKESMSMIRVDGIKIIVVVFILVCTILTNVYFDFPAMGLWLGIFIGAAFTKTCWSEFKHTVSGTIFLFSLVLCASFMPIESLPKPSWLTTLNLGLISSLFDNIPLTKICIEQGNYDWAKLAYTVGFGGSMLWFGSSSGVALSSLFPQIKSVGTYLKHGWAIVVSYFLGYVILSLLIPWQGVITN